MKKLYLLLLLIGFNSYIKSQDITEKISDFYGLWKGVFFIKEPFTDITKDYLIFKKNIFLEFSLKDDTVIRISSFGFSNSEDIDSISNNLYEEGRNFIAIQEGYINIISPAYYGVDDDELFIFYSDYKKLDKAPQKVLKFLHNQSKRDQRNYIKEFLDLDGREITTPKTYIYTAPNLKGKMYLLKGDIVTVLEEEKDFVKFEYETDKSRIITGYLKKEDLE